MSDLLAPIRAELARLTSERDEAVAKAVRLDAECSALIRDLSAERAHSRRVMAESDELRSMVERGHADRAAE